MNTTAIGTTDNRLHAALCDEFFDALEMPVLALCAAGLHYATATEAERERDNLGGEVRMSAAALDVVIQDWDILWLGAVFARFGERQQSAVIFAQMYCDHLRVDARAELPDVEFTEWAERDNRQLLDGMVKTFNRV